MKRCNACSEEFEDKFSFCPVDATPLNSLAAEVLGLNPHSHLREITNDEIRVVEVAPCGSRPDFHLTMINNASLIERLAKELRYLSHQLRLAWPALKRDPIGFGNRLLAEVRLRLRSTLLAPNSVAGLAIAMVLVLTVGLIMILLSNRSSGDSALAGRDREAVQFVEFPSNPTASPEGRGIGAGSNEGRVGFNSGRGEGSGAVPKKSRGGGGGGQHDALPAQIGKPPQPSEIPAPIPKFPRVQNQSLPVAGINIDPALWKNLPMAVYGDPRSKATAPSNGPGELGGMGSGSGTGVGEGSRSGIGKGNDGNIGDGTNDRGCCGTGGTHGNNDDFDRVVPVNQVSERAHVLAKPEPQYTEEARKGGVTGSVVLRVVFSRTGEVTNIHALQSLPFGLTERAIAAARLIRFRPATKDGRPVNVSMQLEYNFNLY